jgi:DNA uptake protein ComE-like DNA-binding protein
MYEVTSSASKQAAAIRLGSSHGYRIDGDIASINAELSFMTERGAPAAQQHWALQLWACDEPYDGGVLSGFKVAEAPIVLPAHPDTEPSQLDAVTFAHLPASSRDYSMVLVLATGLPGAFDQVHDFANYSARERFIAPHFAGSVGYRILSDGKVALGAQRVLNPRAGSNLSGSLALQLWLLLQPYRGGSLCGTLLASAALGRIHGQSEIEPGEQEVALAQAANAGPHVALMLCEWTAEGYLTRDYCNFAELWARPVAIAEPVAVAEPQPAAAVAVAVAEPESAVVLVAEPAAVVVAAALAPATQWAEKSRLSLNSASAEELVRATGINKKLAADVVKARPFKSFDELVKVRGIGEKIARKFRDAMKL